MILSLADAVAIVAECVYAVWWRLRPGDSRRLSHNHAGAAANTFRHMARSLTSPSQLFKDMAASACCWWWWRGGVGAAAADPAGAGSLSARALTACPTGGLADRDIADVLNHACDPTRTSQSAAARGESLKTVLPSPCAARGLAPGRPCRPFSEECGVCCDAR